MDVSIKEDKHPSGGFGFAEDYTAGWERADLTGVDDLGTIGFCKSLEMFYATKGFNEVGWERRHCLTEDYVLGL